MFIVRSPDAVSNTIPFSNAQESDGLPVDKQTKPNSV